MSGRRHLPPRAGPATPEVGGHTPTPVDVRLGQVVAAGGDVLGRLDDGRVVFCEGGLPGEVVRILLAQQRRDYARGTVVEVVEPSPRRIAPPCPHATQGCGGCQWQHTDVEDQLAHKVAIVADCWRRIAHLDLPEGPPPYRLPPDGYRTSVRLAVDHDGRPSYLHRHSRRTVAVDSCLVAHRSLEELITSVRLRPMPAADAGERSRGARRGAGGRPEVGLRVAVSGGQRLVLPTGGAVVVSAPVDAEVIGARGGGHLDEEVGGRSWRVSARSFFQSGPAAASALAEAVDAAVGPLGASGHLVDLYAGVGVLGGVVAARRGWRLTAVESDAGAAADAAANLADLDADVAACAVDGWHPVAADVVVADPSRPGLGRPGVAAVVATGASRVVVVSCDPASSARDAALLRDAGFRAARLAVLDLFPHTFHVEAVTTYVRP